jgi:uncharacterized protein (DUF2384 family)
MTATQTADAVGTLALLPGDDQAALRAFFEIAEAWKKDGGQLNRDQLERISHIINIYKCLRILFTDQEAADKWVGQPNKAPFLQGRSALEFMVHDGYLSDIFQVRRYLDAQRG